jgi:hypothetical protein
MTRRIADYRCASMHGCAVASAAVGKTVGVAPEAEVVLHRDHGAGGAVRGGAAV